MTFLEFKDKMFDLACFSIYQIYAWRPDFDRNNLTRWTKKGYLIRLRQGYFAFSEYRNKPDYSFYFANRIYRPSYVSLHAALAFYGMIPEAVVQITNVTSLKTADNRFMQFATPEKALLDLLYLYPFYNNEQELEELRLDEDYLHDDLNRDLLMDYCAKSQNKALERRVKLLFKTYDL